MDKFITLISDDEQEFIISKKVARHSKLLKGMLEESNENFTFDKIPLSGISGPILEKICQYLNEKDIGNVNYSPLSGVNSKTKEGKEFVMELLLAANYLDC